MVVFDDRKWKPEIEKQEIELQLLCSNTAELIERLRESRLKKESISDKQTYLLKNFKFLKEEIDKYEKMCVKTKYFSSTPHTRGGDCPLINKSQPEHHGRLKNTP